MFAKHLKNWIISENQDIYKTHWQLYKAGGEELFVIGRDEKLKGVITRNDINKTYNDPRYKTALELCNRNYHFVLDGENNYAAARDLFAEYPELSILPVVNRENDIIDIMTRDRTHWKERFLSDSLPRMFYAYPIYRSALEAKALGYSSVSVIEFGVAGGNGLVNAELHAREISRILGIEIQVYGFDSAKGLPSTNMGYKDLPFQWSGGLFPMDQSLLEERLQFAKLVIGDIKETIRDFLKKFSPAPIACMLIDVDYYSSTLPILSFLKETADDAFIPRIYMYFDDIQPIYEFQGEAQAIKEFNAGNDNMKISPEGEWVRYENKFYLSKIKVCQRFTHPKYNEYIRDGIAGRPGTFTNLK